MKRILALVLGLAMLSALASGCAPTGESGGGQSSPAVSTGSNTSYTIATNNFGAGSIRLIQMRPMSRTRRMPSV